MSLSLPLKYVQHTIFFGTNSFILSLQLTLVYFLSFVQYKSSNLAAYDIVPDVIKKGVDVFVDEGIDAPVDGNLIAWAHGKRTATDENWRAPIVCAYNLRCEIMKTRTSPILEKPLHVNEELKLMGEVSNFVSGKLFRFNINTLPYLSLLSLLLLFQYSSHYLVSPFT